MRILVKSIVTSIILLNSIAYASTPGIYLGIHQGWGSLKGKLDAVPLKSTGRSSCGLFEKDLLGMWTLHYQHSKQWGVTTTLNSQFSPLETAVYKYDAGMGYIIAKREFFKESWLHLYCPVGAWGAAYQPTHKLDKKREISPMIDYGVLGGLGLQLHPHNLLLVDASYKRLWSFKEMNHTGILTVSIGVKIKAMDAKPKDSWLLQDTHHKQMIDEYVPEPMEGVIEE